MPRPRRGRADARHDFAQQTRAVLERAAVRPGPRVGAEKFMQQVAVAMLDVDEIGADLRRDLGRGDVVVDQPAQLRRR